MNSKVISSQLDGLMQFSKLQSQSIIWTEVQTMANTAKLDTILMALQEVLSLQGVEKAVVKRKLDEFYKNRLDALKEYYSTPSHADGKEPPSPFGDEFALN